MVRLYKNAILLLVSVYVLYLLMPFFWPYLYSEQTQIFLGFAGVDAVFTFSGIQIFIIPCFYILFCAGLYKFSSGARIGYTILVLMNLTIGAFGLGYSASAYLDTSIGYLLSLLEGAILAMIYTTDIAKKFKKK
jgi:hypothetical protein